MVAYVCNPRSGEQKQADTRVCQSSRLAKWRTTGSEINTLKKKKKKIREATEKDITTWTVIGKHTYTYMSTTVYSNCMFVSSVAFRYKQFFRAFRAMPNILVLLIYSLCVCVCVFHSLQQGLVIMQHTMFLVFQCLNRI